MCTSYIKVFIGIIVSLLFVVGCKNTYPEYDEVPSVEYLYAQVTTDSSDKKLAFTFMLYDGDGNVGLDNNDTAAPYIDSFQQNFHATAHYIANSDSTQLPYNLSYRIPRLRAEGQNKFIKAKVSIEMTFAKSVFTYDSVFFTYYVYDRDLQKSNIDTSSVILF